MKRMYKIVALILALGLMLSFTALAVELEGIDWDDVLPEREYDLIYNENNYNGHIVLGEVIVSLKKGVPNDTDYKALFPELDISEIEIIFEGTETRRTELLIKLKEKTRESVIEAIELLKENPVVYFAEVNGYYHIGGENYVPPFYEEVDFDDVIPEKDYDRLYNEANFERNFVSGQVTVCFKKGVPLDADFAALLPEIEIIATGRVLNLAGRAWTVFTLSEETRESVVEAINLLKDNEYVYFTEPNYLYEVIDAIVKGDANRDGKVTNSDLILVARHIVGLEEFGSSQRVNADINTDNEITNADLIAIAQMIVGIA